MKRFLVAVFFFLPIAVLGINILPHTSEEPKTVPNPLDLQINWWDYYDVDDKKLKERKDATQSYFTKLSQTLNNQESREAAPYFDRIIKGLGALIELKENAPKAAPESSFIKGEKLSFVEWIQLSQKILQKEEELEYLELKRSLAKSSYHSAEKYVDASFIAYLKHKKEKKPKLIEGLSVMQGRIFLAIEKIQINNFELLINQKNASVDRFLKEAREAYKRIDPKTIDIEQLQRELTAAKEKEEKASQKYILSYETIPFIEEGKNALSENVLSDQNLLSAKLSFEISALEMVNLEIQYVLGKWFGEKQKPTKKQLRRKIETWRSLVNEIKKEISSSETSSEQLLQQALKSLALDDKESTSHPRTYAVDRSVKRSEGAILQIEKLKNALHFNTFLMDQLILIKTKAYFDPLDRIVSFWNSLIAFFKTNGSWFTQTLFKIKEFPVTPLALIKFFAILIISFSLGRITRTLIRHFGRKQNRIKITSIYILSHVSNYTIMLFGLFFAGYAIGLDLTILAYTAGAVAIWIGFSLQSIFHNFVSGIIVLLTKTIRIHDMVELDTGEIGTVTDLNLRTTVIRTFDGKDLILPNADLINKRFLNYTLSNHTIRIHIPFRVAIYEDNEKIKKIAIEAAKKVEITSDILEPELWITGYGENFKSVELVVWINTYIRGKTASRQSQYYWALDEAFKEHGIVIPTPMQNIHIIKPLS